MKFSVVLIITLLSFPGILLASAASSSSASTAVARPYPQTSDGAPRFGQFHSPDDDCKARGEDHPDDWRTYREAMAKKEQQRANFVSSIHTCYGLADRFESGLGLKALLSTSVAPARVIHAAAARLTSDDFVEPCDDAEYQHDLRSAYVRMVNSGGKVDLSAMTTVVEEHIASQRSLVEQYPLAAMSLAALVTAGFLKHDEVGQVVTSLVQQSGLTTLLAKLFTRNVEQTPQ